MARHRRTPWTTAQMPAQDGRRFVVTGATGGLGLELTRALATAGAEVVMAVRDTAKGEAGAERVRRTGAPGRIEVRWLDVADLGSVHAFASNLDRLDVLVNNAGIMAVPESRTVDGFESQIGTNHLGHFALTNLLLPRLHDRVVVVSSASHRSGTIEVDDLDFARRGYVPYAAYAQSKLANLLFLAELDRRLAATDSDVRAVGAHPGYTATGIHGGTGNKAFTRLGSLGNALIGMKPSQGAQPLLYAATGDLPGNSYVGPHGPGELLGHPTLVGRSEMANDPDLASALWRKSESLTGVTFPL
ncbi:MULTISPECIES: oxidoreductase [unclassified Nocardioides]|uniref:oxidoreductase n=1 Tax=unclassified Nocardioides TaxID=2615069 RepID=UPI000702C941|nr:MULTISPECIES: oxidoreductase [unclassified Nocardioides]KQZ70462.1 oxidoreductase [Nocardioides sp. Root151]KRF18333.1 oxidoreductase [Nocardioides sp. Soil796]